MHKLKKIVLKLLTILNLYKLLGIYLLKARPTKLCLII